MREGVAKRGRPEVLARDVRDIGASDADACGCVDRTVEGCLAGVDGCGKGHDLKRGSGRVQRGAAAVDELAVTVSVRENGRDVVVGERGRGCLREDGARGGVKHDD